MTEHLEQPYTKREMRYAPAKPFADAINEWIAVRRRRNRSAVSDPRTTLGGALRFSGIEELARSAGMPSKSLRRYQTGESQWISIDSADRLAMALNIPLNMLADEFLTLNERRRREQNEVAA